MYICITNKQEMKKYKYTISPITKVLKQAGFVRSTYRVGTSCAGYANERRNVAISTCVGDYRVERGGYDMASLIVEWNPNRDDNSGDISQKGQDILNAIVDAGFEATMSKYGDINFRMIKVYK